MGDLEIVTTADRRDLDEQARDAFRPLRPEFIFHDPVHAEHDGRVETYFPQYDVLILDDGQVVAGGWGVPIRMEGVPDPRPAARAAAATRFFISYVQRQVFDPVGVKDATCAPVRDAMLMYPPPGAGTARGSPAPAGPSACSGGGWFMTPAGLRRVLEGLISGSLLSGRQRQQMDGNCLGWDCSGAGQAGYRGKYGGGGDPGSAGRQIFFGILGGTIPVVIATNSNFPPLPAVVQTALHAATSAR